jgi:hypothetical protein
MARLFIGTREQQLINDLTKEFIKDVVGQQIILFPISTLHTKIHPVYDEAVEKIFENPITLDVLALSPTNTNSWNQFGYDSNAEIELHIQPRDLLDKQLDIESGDMFLYGDKVYEILTCFTMDNIFGQVEYDKSKYIKAKLARSGQFDLDTFKRMIQTNNPNFNKSQEQHTFIQQRGLPENEQGATNDHRQMRKRLGDGMAPIALDEGPRKIAADEDDELNNNRDAATDAKGNSFYNE